MLFVCGVGLMVLVSVGLKVGDWFLKMVML